MPTTATKPDANDDIDNDVIGHAPGTPVPALPNCDFPNIAAFKAGNWNGGEYEDGFLEKLLENFQKYSAGPNPYHRAYVSINHDKFPHLANFRFGQLDHVRIDGDGILRMDAKEVPGTVGQWANSGLLKVPSIEFVRPERDATGKIVGGFVGPDGKFVDGPVIKCLTFLGNNYPGVTDIEPLPTAVFSQRPQAFASAFRGGFLVKFGGMTMQPRDQMLQALQAMGLDITSLTAEVPDQAIADILAFAQKLQATAAGATAPANGGAAGGTVQQAADVPIGAVQLPGVTDGGAAGQPSQITLKFANGQTATGVIVQPAPAAAPNAATHNAVLAVLGPQIAALAKNVNTQGQQLGKFISGGRKTLVDQFCAKMSANGQLTDAQAETIRPYLMSLDHDTTKKFAAVAGKPFEGTDLERAFTEIEATYPVIRQTGRKVLQAPIPKNGDSTGGGPRTGKAGMTPERRAELLKGAGAVGNRLMKTAS